LAITIRAAERNDALHVAALIDLAGHGIEAEFWKAKAGPDGSLLVAARQLVLADTGVPYHLSRAWLVLRDEDVAGGLIGGLVDPSDDVPTGFPDYFAPLLELESFASGYWAVIGIAIYPEYRGQGLARELLAHAEATARAAGARGLSLVVEDANLTALSLYQSLGFEERQRRAWLAYGERGGPVSGCC